MSVLPNHVSMAEHVHDLHQHLADHSIHILVLALPAFLELIVKCLIQTVLRPDIVSMAEHVKQHLPEVNVLVELVLLDHNVISQILHVHKK